MVYVRHISKVISKVIRKANLNPDTYCHLHATHRTATCMPHNLLPPACMPSSGVGWGWLYKLLYWFLYWITIKKICFHVIQWRHWLHGIQGGLRKTRCPGDGRSLLIKCGSFLIYCGSLLWSTVFLLCLDYAELKEVERINSNATISMWRWRHDSSTV